MNLFAFPFALRLPCRFPICEIDGQD